jgi:hypothetical protein
VPVKSYSKKGGGKREINVKIVRRGESIGEGIIDEELIKASRVV